MKHMLFAATLALVLLVSTPATAWWGGGHDLLTLAAVRALPSDVPPFLKGMERAVAHMSYDPDISKNRGAPIVNAAERSAHYIDLEFLSGRTLPERRYDFIALCQELGHRPESVGFLPYAVAEATERLAVAFAEYRKWPDNEHIQNKCAFYAGTLAHYAQDMCQPLHLTLHENGRKKADGTVEHKGVHEKVDALPEFFEMDPDRLVVGLRVTAVDSLMSAIARQVEVGFALVDRVYELADVLPKSGQEDWVFNEEAKAFAWERARESARFTSSMILTAWRRSEGIHLNGWLDRSGNR